jgi:cytochrome c
VDSFEWNKIFGAVLAALVAALGLAIATGYFFPVAPLEKQAYVVEGVEEEAAAGGAAGGEAEQPIALLLASANPTRGEAQFKKCAACHTIDKGGAAGIGPNLYGIMGRAHAQAAGYDYSDALDATASQRWDWEGMSAWLANPRKYIPGNKMSFAGIGKAQDRADLLAYLNTKADSPLPLPAAPAPAPAADAAAPAAGGGDAAALAAPATSGPETAQSQGQPEGMVDKQAATAGAAP